MAEEAFDWSFNDADLPSDTWKVMMYSEILDFHNLGSTIDLEAVKENPETVSAAGPVSGQLSQA